MRWGPLLLISIMIALIVAGLKQPHGRCTEMVAPQPYWKPWVKVCVN